MSEAILYGKQTRLAVENFPISGQPLPPEFIHALGSIKAVAGAVNLELGLLDPAMAKAIEESASEVASGRHDAQFPIDVYQTGSGTSTNMNANEVIAALASARLGSPVHANDHVNLGQSSNDIIPTAIHVSAYQEIATHLLPSIRELAASIGRKRAEVGKAVKNGRTHLMDALPLTIGQEMGGWQQQLLDAEARIESALPRLARLAIGGTAIGTGANTHPEFGRRVAARLAASSGFPFVTAPDYFAAMGGQDTAVEISGQLKTAAVALMKISNDLRWMNSGPISGLSEVRLPALQAGSSIMPGKVNPVIPEAAAMVAARVIGNDLAITVAGQSGNFQLNVMLPLIAHTLLESVRLLANICRALAEKAISGLEVNLEHLHDLVGRNPILATFLAPRIGYDAAARIVERATRERRTILDVAKETTDIPADELARLLNPNRTAS